MKVTPKKLIKTLVATAVCSAIIGCSSDDDSDSAVNDVIAGTADDVATLNLAFTGMDVLGENFVYEGWIIVNGEPVSTGRFTDNTSDTQTATVANAAAATAYVLTIEPAVGDDPAPAPTHVLAGDIVNNGSTLSIGHPAALGTDLTSASGSFITATPSSENPGETFDQGIWWLIPPEPFAAGLSLPTLPEGWAYEGWVVGADGPISTGVFTDANAADSDGAGATAGPNGTPPFPGQDFIDPAISLTGLTAVISVEPVPDDSPAPFAIKPLFDHDIENVGAGGSQDMVNEVAMNQPAGTLTIDLP